MQKQEPRTYGRQTETGACFSDYVGEVSLSGLPGLFNEWEAVGVLMDRCCFSWTVLPVCDGLNFQ